MQPDILAEHKEPAGGGRRGVPILSRGMPVRLGPSTSTLPRLISLRSNRSLSSHLNSLRSRVLPTDEFLHFTGVRFNLLDGSERAFWLCASLYLPSYGFSVCCSPMQEQSVTERRNMEYTMLMQKTVLTCTVLLAWGAYGPGFSQETSKERPNLAADSHLPSGKGLAAEFRGDRGIESHPSVIFADSFEGGDYRAHWDSCRDKGEKVLSLVDDSESSPVVGHKSLRVEATLGQNTGGGVTKWFEPSATVFIRFYTKFDPTCDYVHHFCTLRANKSLRGKDRPGAMGQLGPVVSPRPLELLHLLARDGRKPRWKILG